MGMDQEILQCLSASLGTDPNARMGAEIKLSELLANPGKYLLRSVDEYMLKTRVVMHRGWTGTGVYRAFTGCRRLFTTDKSTSFML